MTTAQKIIESIQGAHAVTLQYGYAMFIDKPRVLFEIGKNCRRKDNAAGRCTRFECTYEDGSRLVMTWSESQGVRYKAAR